MINSLLVEKLDAVGELSGAIAESGDTISESREIVSKLLRAGGSGVDSGSVLLKAGVELVVAVELGFGGLKRGDSSSSVSLDGGGLFGGDGASLDEILKSGGGSIRSEVGN